MSGEEESVNEDVEFQNTQREIEDLRRKEEELMSKMTKLANKRKSASDNSLDDNDEEEHEEIGRRRRPSLSKGNSPTKQKRPDSITLSHESGTFRSRGSSSSSISPTKEHGVKSISPSKRTPVSASSRSSSRSSSHSPTKTQVTSNARSSISVSSSRSSRSSSTSPVKRDANRTTDQTYKISIRSPRAKENRSPVGSTEKMSYNGRASPVKSSSQRSTSPKKPKSGRPMNRSYSTPHTNIKELKQQQTRRGSGDLTESKSSAFAKNRAVSTESSSKEQLLDLKDGDEVKGGPKASSTGNLSSVEVPENHLIKRGARGSRSSVESGRSRNSININDDSYEIIEIDYDTPQTTASSEKIGASPHSKRGKDNLTAREKIEQELAEQVKREEELNKIHSETVVLTSEEVTNEDDDEDDKEEDSDAEIDEEPEDIFDEQKEDVDDEEEETEVKQHSISAKEKIEQELAEQKLREEELRLSNERKQAPVDADEEYRKEEDELNGDDGDDVFEDQLEEESEDQQDDDNEKSQLSTWEKIALEIEEEKKRDEEMRKKGPNEEAISEESDGEEEVENEPTDTRTRINFEIEELINHEEGAGEEEDSGEASEEESAQPISVQDMIEMEIKEIEERERELKQTHTNEEEVDDEEEDEGIEDSEFDGNTKSKIHQEIEEFKQKESDLRKQHGVEDEGDSEDDEDLRIDTVSIIEREIAEQKKKDAEYRKQHFREHFSGQEDATEEDEEMEKKVDEDNNGTREGLEDVLGDESASSDSEDFQADREVKKEESVVTQGITRKFIHMFNTDGDNISKRQREEQSDEDTRINKNKVSVNRQKEEVVPQVDDDVSEEDDVDEQEDLSEATKMEHEDHREVINSGRSPNIQAASPGKKLVLKRKKSKKAEEDHTSKGTDVEKTSKATVADTRRSFEKQKESKPAKKAHPLAMHWEKLQEQHRSEATKNDIEALRKKQESEKRKKKELEERLDKEKTKQTLEIKELLDRRRSLAEAWENKNNNEDSLSPVKKHEINTKTKKEGSKISPRKSPGKKKELNTSRKVKEELPKSARANIKLWEQKIASQNQ